MKVVLGVSGSVAAYRACDLARDLMRNGAEVRVCLTEAAAKFVTPALFEALTGNPCVVDAFDEPEAGRMAHIDWARWCDFVVICPASASTLNRLAAGIATDMLSTLVLAFDGPVIVAPAMNPTMYASEPVVSALKSLKNRGYEVVEPTSGDVACGENGQGKLASNAEILDVCLAMARRQVILQGKKVVITSGPTQEPIDSVRYLTNRSSGKMGAALARAALWMGADVHVIAGPGSVVYPQQATTTRVRTAEEMLAQALQASSNADWIIGAAAVADYRPAHPSAGKIRRSSENLQLELIPNPDIIASLAQANPGAKVVGFAAEPTSDTAIAIEKLQRKGLAAIVHNDVSSAGIGFESDDNAITLLTADGSQSQFGPARKLACAFWLLEQLSS